MMTSITNDIHEILEDPNAVHQNLLRGTLARPSVEQIIHVYGAEALRAALPSPPDPDARVAELERVVADQAAMLEERFSEVRLAGYENGVFTFHSPIVPLIAEAMAQALQPDPDADPANYTETAITHNELGELTMTLQRKSGKTPHQLRKEAETRAEQAERRERALLENNQSERSALVKLASLRHRLRESAERARADPDRARDLLDTLRKEFFS